jgi:RimJ/RimL family protein N-acetyltransferase
MTEFNLQPTLIGTNIMLRPVSAEDRDALYAVASDPLIWEVHPAHDRWQRDVYQAYFDQGIASGGALAVVDLASNILIGSSRYSHEFALDGEIEIGWTFLARSHWGGNINREMKRLMIGHALQHFGHVIFRIGETNIRSRRAMEKIGGVLTDRIQISMMAGKEVRHVTYRMGREEFNNNLAA